MTRKSSAKANTGDSHFLQKCVRAYSNTTPTPRNKSIGQKKPEASSIKGEPTEPAIFRRKRRESPCDKLWIRVNHPIEVGPILKFRERSFIPFKRPYLLEKSGFFLLPNGARVAVYVGHSCSEIQLNPTQWQSYRSMESFTRLLLGQNYKKSYISKIHLHVDLPIGMMDAVKSIRIGRASISKTYDPASVITRKSGDLKEIQLTTQFGSERRRCIMLYDATKKHGYKEPTTRIERRDNTAKVAIVSHLERLPELKELTPFAHVSFGTLADSSGLNKADRLRYEVLELKAEKMGLQRAISEERRKDRKHFHERFKNILKKIKRLEIDVDRLFQAQMTRFLKRHMSRSEKQLLSIMTGGPACDGKPKA